MANITNIRKMRVVQASASNHFALDANGKPDPTVFNNAQWVEASTASVSVSPAGRSFENDRTSGSWGMSRPIPEAAFDADGNLYETLTGTLSCNVRARTLGVPEDGDDFESYDDLPLIQMIKSGAFVAATDIADDANWGDSFDGEGTDNNAATYTTGTGLTAGELFQAVVGNNAVVHNINWKDTSDDSVNFTPSWFGVDSGDPIPDSSEIRTMYTLTPDLSGGVPVHIEMFFDTFAIRAYGCVASSITAQTVGEMSLEFAFAFEVGQFEFDYSTTAVKNNSFLDDRVPRPCGKVAQRMGAYMVVSEPLPEECRPNTLSDYLLESAGHLCIQEFTFTVTNTVERIKCSNNLLGLQSMRVVNQEYEVTATRDSANSSGNQDTNILDADLLNERARNYSFAFGPHGPGMGVGIFLPAGYLKSTAKVRNVGGTFVTQDLVIGADEWFGDNVTVNGTIPAGSVSANKRVKIGFAR